jgi:hypothetical protein
MIGKDCAKIFINFYDWQRYNFFKSKNTNFKKKLKNASKKCKKKERSKKTPYICGEFKTYKNS